MICSSVNLVRFIVRPQVGPDSNRIWRKNPGAGQTIYRKHDSHRKRTGPQHHALSQPNVISIRLRHLSLHMDFPGNPSGGTMPDLVAVQESRLC